MSTTFVIPGLFIYSQDIQGVAAPRIEDHAMAQWLVDLNINQYDLLWVKRDPNVDPSNYFRNRIWDTAIRFHRVGDAVLWRLTWV